MKVAGFTFIRNAVKLDYPILEAIMSILPICDEFVVAVGNSSDDTLQLIKSIHSEKIRIIETVWDENMRLGGRVLAAETDKAFAAVSDDCDWAFYIQGDEVVSEKDLPRIYEAMKKYKDDPKTEGFLFHYRHFYGSYQYVAQSYHWYKKEIRIIRNDKNIFSYRDAQGFRKKPNEKLNVRKIDAYIYHYGWVKHPNTMLKKTLEAARLWENSQVSPDDIDENALFDYMNGIHNLQKYEGMHPVVMQKRIERLNWDFNFDMSKNTISLKNKFRMFTEKYFNWIPGEYRNYRLLK